MQIQGAGEPIGDPPTATAEHGSWSDASLPVSDRVNALLAAMTLEEKVAQLYSVWVGGDPAGDDVAPHQHALIEADLDFQALIRYGLGQFTRPFGTAKVEPGDGAKALARMQRDVVEAGRFGIPALVHEECLTGFMTFGATIYPTPLAWGATFDPVLVERMAGQIGRSMREVGVHQGLAPVLDVVRDARWGRVEESIGEDPYLVGTVSTAYVRGLQSAGIVATLKHFVGYSGSEAGRNHAPVRIGPREFADVFLPPFEMALRAGAGSVMASYTETDGVPSAADVSLLTDLLRDRLGFAGTVVSDYFGISFLEIEHGVAGSPVDSAALALAAGIDVELPGVRCYGTPLLEAVRAGTVPEALVERAVRRVLTQKIEIGLLDPDWTPEPGPASAPEQGIDLDPPEARGLAREIAEASVVLLDNDGSLPLSPAARVAVVGPLADDTAGMLGCYTFASHLGHAVAETGEPEGPPIATLLSGIRAELPDAGIVHVAGCDVAGDDRSGFAPAAEAAGSADVCVVVVGDRAGLFGRGTSGEGCDAEDMRLPGVQEEFIQAMADTGTPVVLVLLAGRPYALGAVADRVSAVVQAFFPGEEGGAAVAGVLSGRVCPSGRLPVSVPRRPGGQPFTYLAPPLGHRSEVSNIDPTPLYPFGHGLSYMTFTWDDVHVGGADEPLPDAGPIEVPTHGSVTVSVRICNTGEFAGAEVVQVYLHDPVAQVTRPQAKLVGYSRVFLQPGEARRVTFGLHADLAAFTGVRGDRVVEPGDLEFRLARSSLDTTHVVKVTLTGPERVVGFDRHLTADVEVS
ncbi:glycoside hydrolase family 3 N-terminal domain-containing protein [Phytoactinopolyspora mesophila]|uniref:Glycosyl hydrolase n=1 Tax=Phytoactinopolyspora mesophila TaxID=2650750 RepID=A0A7K3M1E9_9ACTN|nr:glycoside hydrolase family 3 N-terminal domain-containing protein [Phytoactinopolyspora mesophila]NDL57070.1 glycosyl hydrolase [Phytoactinopolyspora mesophila]